MSRAYDWAEDKISKLEKRIDALEAEREKQPPVTRRRSKICTVCGVKHTRPHRESDL
jgi:DNA repair exonuclease SbcCD ATPase subunit